MEEHNGNKQLRFWLKSLRGFRISYLLFTFLANSMQLPSKYYQQPTHPSGGGAAIVSPVEMIHDLLLNFTYIDRPLVIPKKIELIPIPIPATFFGFNSNSNSKIFVRINSNSNSNSNSGHI